MTTFSSKDASKIFDKLSQEDRVAWFATGNVTTGELRQVLDDGIVVHHVGRVRGMIVARPGKSADGQLKYLFKTRDEARAVAMLFRERCRAVSGLTTPDARKAWIEAHADLIGL